jgi:hypothetical protein
VREVLAVDDRAGSCEENVIEPFGHSILFGAVGAGCLKLNAGVLELTLQGFVEELAASVAVPVHDGSVTFVLIAHSEVLKGLQYNILVSRLEERRMHQLGVVILEGEDISFTIETCWLDWTA